MCKRLTLVFSHCNFALLCDFCLYTFAIISDYENDFSELSQVRISQHSALKSAVRSKFSLSAWKSYFGWSAELTSSAGKVVTSNKLYVLTVMFVLQTLNVCLLFFRNRRTEGDSATRRKVCKSSSHSVMQWVVEKSTSAVVRTFQKRFATRKWVFLCFSLLRWLRNHDDLFTLRSINLFLSFVYVKLKSRRR